MKSALPYVFGGNALKIKGIVGGTAPTPNFPKLVTVADKILDELLAAPMGGDDQDDPVLAIRPISESGKVVKVEPSNAAFHPNCTVPLPPPLVRLTFQTASTTFCFCAGVSGVPFIRPFEVMPSKTDIAKLEGDETVTVTGK